MWDRDLHESLCLFDYRVRFVIEFEMTKTRSDENRYEKKDSQYNKNRRKKKNDSIEDDIDECAETDTHNENWERIWRRRSAADDY